VRTRLRSYYFLREEALAQRVTAEAEVEKRGRREKGEAVEGGIASIKRQKK
jgi:hypothetical protein